MANRLVKLDAVSFTPAIPYVQAQPARCWWQAVYTPGRWVNFVDLGVNSALVFSNITSSKGGLRWAPPTYVNKRFCSPAIPGRQGVPASTVRSAIIGWNSGASSVVPLSGDGSFAFKIGSRPVAIVVGLTPNNLTTLPSEPTHAFYVAGSVIKVYESGVEVLTVPEAHSQATPLIIARSGVVVTYKYGTWSHVSANPAVGPQYLDAAMYFTGDVVFDPVMSLQADVDMTGYAVLRPISVAASDLDYATDGGDAVGYARLPVVGAQGQTNNIIVGAAIADLQAVQVFSSDALRYASGLATLTPLTAEGEDGIEVPAFSYGYSTLWPLSAAGIGFTGQLGDAQVSLRAVDVLASNYPMNYGQAYSTLQPLDIANATLVLPEDDLPLTTSGLGVYDFYFTDERVVSQISDGLEITDTNTAVVSVTDSTFDMLELRDALTFAQVVESIIRSGLVITGDTSAAQRAAVQYAVNVLTGGLSTYNGFEFARFAQTTTHVYGSRADGVYVLRPGDDNGLPINIEVDFGADDFATPAAKAVEAVYLGMATDGQAYLRTNNDGEERLYRVIQRGPIMRAVMAKGITGRRWNLKLEVVDATQFELDLVEVIVGVRARRWTR